MVLIDMIETDRSRTRSKSRVCNHSVDLVILRRDLNDARLVCDGLRTKIMAQQQTLRSLMDEVSGVWALLVEIERGTSVTRGTRLSGKRGARDEEDQE